MNKEIIEKILLEISTPTGLTYSGDTTICDDEVKDIMNYINNIEQQCKKQKEVIDKAREYVNKNLIVSSILDGKKTYCLNDYKFNYEKLLDILKEK